MKSFYFFVFLLLLSAAATGQKKDLVVRTGDSGLYLQHKVASRESFFAIGRMYNVSPKYLASYNKLDLKKGLLIDQKLKIPLTDTNFIQDGNSGAPIYYRSGKQEDLAVASTKFKNVPVEKLQYWNNLSSTQLKDGTMIIIGFLNGSEFPSVAIKQPEKVVSQETQAPPEQNDDAQNVKLAVSTEEKAVATEQGFFKSHFEQQIRIIPASRTETVTAGIFKTSSGWQDSKYYMLIDKVPPGTIIRVINPTSNKAIYAKVLGEMSGIRQNEGLNVRISNAAASTLQITDEDKFIVTINY